MTHAEILAGVRAGDEAAFAAAVETYGPKLHSTALRMTRDHARAEDAVQKSWLTLWTKSSMFRGDAQLSTWLHRVVVNHVLMEMRTLKRRGGADTVDAPVERAGGRYDDPAALVEAEDAARALERRISRVRPMYLAALRLRAAGMKGAEIHRLLGVSVGSVKMRLHRGRAALGHAPAHAPRPRPPAPHRTTMLPTAPNETLKVRIRFSGDEIEAEGSRRAVEEAVRDWWARVRPASFPPVSSPAPAAPLPTPLPAEPEAPSAAPAPAAPADEPKPPGAAPLAAPGRPPTAREAAAAEGRAARRAGKPRRSCPYPEQHQGIAGARYVGWQEGYDEEARRPATAPPPTPAPQAAPLIVREIDKGLAEIDKKPTPPPTPASTDSRTSYEQGLDAYAAGTPRGANPKAGEHARKAWENGWDAGKALCEPTKARA